MPLYLKNNALLVTRGKLAQSCDCCVPPGCCGKGESLASAIGYVPYVITLQLTAGFSNAEPEFWNLETYTPPGFVYENIGTWTYRTNVVNSEVRYCRNDFVLVNFVAADGSTDTNEYPVNSNIEIYKPGTTNQCTLSAGISDQNPAGRVPVFPYLEPNYRYYPAGFSTKFSLTATTYSVTNYAWFYSSSFYGYPYNEPPPPVLPVLPSEDYFLTYEESLSYPNIYSYPGQTDGYAMWLTQRMKYVFTLTISEA